MGNKYFFGLLQSKKENGKHMPENSIKLNLLENGIDFILKGIDELFENDDVFLSLNIDAKNIKYGCILLFAGFLLLLKERLAQHLPELIFQGDLRTIREKCKKGNNLKTINLNCALERLEIGPKVKFTDSDLEVIFRMQYFRNIIEHYKFEFDKYEILVSINSFLNVIDKFMLDELQIDIVKTEDSKKLISKIRKINSVYEREINKIKQEMLSELLIKKVEFQESREEILGALDKEYWANKGFEKCYIVCPECGDESLIAFGDYKGICINQECNYFSLLTTCDRCGEIIVGFKKDVLFCDNCELYFREDF